MKKRSLEICIRPWPLDALNHPNREDGWQATVSVDDAAVRSGVGICGQESPEGPFAVAEGTTPQNALSALQRAIGLAFLTSKRT